MYVVGISGSPRENGNTGILVNKVLDSLKEKGAKTRYFSLSGTTLAPCNACGLCEKGEGCIKQDDLKEMLAEMIQADAIVVGSPSYFQGPTAQVKAFMDRTKSVYRKESLKGKVGLAISVEADSGATDTIHAINRFFALQKMIHLPGATAKGNEERDVLHDMKGLRAALEAADELAELVNRLR